ncbi:hypothetical protein GCK72_015773 [Caenorhabditis remanei]|uniref:Uncharacterized protein n=1 Tax=Caenorhabditis remanei TaxID=31234 RepID=A0A6A5GV06_CAERE|nr:hypothetical protein GCK72_015773 [Caenorhabditis remanei]KAF1759308.1 hypothetical protein GCK72_015773 [Caenorhabditis remanei]
MVAAHQSTIAKLEKQLKKERAEHKETAKQLESLKRENRLIKRDLALEKEQNKKNLESQHEELQASIQKLTAQNLEFQKALDDYRREIAEKEVEIQNLLKESDDVRGNLEKSIKVMEKDQELAGIEADIKLADQFKEIHRLERILVDVENQMNQMNQHFQMVVRDKDSEIIGLRWRLSAFIID